jgi:hypothetical protein
MMRKNMAYGSLLSAAMLLVGCGGGGGDSPSNAGSPEGLYEGTISNGLEHNTVVLDDNRYYAIYGDETESGFVVAGLIQGSGVPNNGSFTSTDLRDYYFDGSVFTGTLSASYREGRSFNGSITEGGSTVTFTGTPPNDSEYNYDTTANLSNITGAWNLFTVQGETITLNIQTSGAFAASSSGGCDFDGTIAPRASGKNMFDVELTFGAAPCAFPDQSANGIAIESLVDGLRQLVIAGTTADRSGGTVIFGAR